MDSRLWLEQLRDDLARQGLSPSYIDRLTEELTDHALNSQTENPSMEAQQVYAQIGTTAVEERADDVSAARVHRREPSRSRAPKEPQQERLCLVIDGVSSEYSACIHVRGCLMQKGIPLDTRILLDICLDRQGRAADGKLDLSFAQLIDERGPGGYDDVKNSAWVLARQPIDGSENNTLGNACGCSNPQFTRCRVGKKLDFPDPLIEFIERGDASFEQCTPKFRWLDAVRTTVKQWHTECLFCVGQRP